MEQWSDDVGRARLPHNPPFVESVELETMVWFCWAENRAEPLVIWSNEVIEA